MGAPKGRNQIAKGCRAPARLPWYRRERVQATPTGLNINAFLRYSVCMPQSFSGIHVHLVFSTRDRRPFLVDPDLRAQTHAYLGGICKNLACDPLVAGGVADHVHILA